MKKMNKKRGFTITELVIVISVIAILSAVLIPTFSGLVKKSKESVAVQEAHHAYTEYLTNHDFTGDEPADDFIYEAAEDKFVVIKDGKLDKTVYDDRAAALIAMGLGYTEANAETTDVAGLTAYVEEEN